MIFSGIFCKLALGTLGFGAAGALGYGIYELTKSSDLTIKEALLKSYKVLDVDGTQDDAEWSTLVNSYPSNGSSSSSGKQIISGLTSLTGGGSGTTDGKTTLKNKCRNLLNNKYENDTQQDYIDAKNWCSKVKTGQ